MNGINRPVCPACCNRVTRHWKSIGGWRLYRCAGCGVGFLHPRPPIEELRRRYERETASHGDDFEENRKRLADIERFQRRGRLLDIGSGAGSFLAFARERGWHCEGIEINEGKVEHARHELGLTVHHGDPCEIDLPQSSFDVITLFHSLEHLFDLRGALEQIRRWLKPNGVVAVKVVNCEGVEARMFGVNWTGWELPLHLYHFSPRALRTALFLNGFKIVYLRTDISTLPLRFLFTPIAIPSHHYKLIRLVSARFPAAKRWLEEFARSDNPVAEYLRRKVAGRDMLAIAKPHQ